MCAEQIEESLMQSTWTKNMHILGYMDCVQFSNSKGLINWSSQREIGKGERESMCMSGEWCWSGNASNNSNWEEEEVVTLQSGVIKIVVCVCLSVCVDR